MKTDRELLELAAKAAGLHTKHELLGGDAMPFTVCENRFAQDFRQWNPLTDDGAALQLLVALNMHFQANQFKNLDYVCAGIDNPDFSPYWDPQESKWLAEEKGQPDRFAAARRAIVRAAAAIGEQML